MKETVHDRIRRYACFTTEQIMQELDINGSGLDKEKIHSYRQGYGSNEQKESTQISILHCVIRAFINPFSIILFALALISLCTNVLLPNRYGPGISNVVIIAAMLLLSGGVRLIQELHSKRVADSLTVLVRTTVSVCRNGIWLEVPSEELVVGDLVRLEAGDRVPADIRLISAQDFFVSQSVITGESGIQEKFAVPAREVPKKIKDYTNTVFRGTSVIGGKGKGIILAVGEDTVYGGLSIRDISRKQGFNQGSNSIAWVLIRFMIILVPIVFIACGVTKGNWVGSFLFALSVAVGLTPELLPMVVNACLAKGSFQMGQKQTIVKNINAMQELGSMDILCVDKTGTLTGDTIFLEYYMDVMGNESGKALDYAFLNSYYHTSVKNYLDLAILKCKTMPGKKEYFEQLVAVHPIIDEQPFDYNRKFISVLLKDEMDYLVVIKGVVEAVVSRCRYVEYKGKVLEINENAAKNAHAIVDEITEDGMKVLAVAYKKKMEDTLEDEEQDFILLGYLAFFDAPKQSAAGAIEKLNKLQVDVRILTGDEKITTLSICRRLGISTDSVLTGAEFELLVDNNIQVCVEQTRIFAELSPKQKAKIVEIFQENGHTVGFLGDGMNDLQAEIQADVSISVDTAAEALKESADVVLLKKDLNVLEQGILEGRKAFANIAKYIKITSSSNFGNICAVVVASVLLPFFPMTSIQLLMLNLLYDILCLILPWDNVDPEILTEPQKWVGRKLSRFMMWFGPISTIFDLLTFGFLFFVLCPSVCGGAFKTLNIIGKGEFIVLFQTGWFLESLWTQVLILQLLRTAKIPFVQSKPSWSVSFISILGILLFTFLTFTPLGPFIGLTAMPFGYYGFLVLNVILYLLLVMIAKIFYCRKYRELL